MPYLLDHDWRGRALDPPHARFELFRRDDLVYLELDVPYAGDPAPKDRPGRLWGLWQYEVIELFVAGAGAEYLELELGPHGHHLFLGFTGIRRMEDEELPLVGYDVRRREGRWLGCASFEARLLPPAPNSFNLCAISGPEPREHRSLVVLPGSAPDFHQPAAFLPCAEILRPEAPSAACGEAHAADGDRSASSQVELRCED